MAGVYYTLGDHYDMVSASLLVYTPATIEITIKFISSYCNL